MLRRPSQRRRSRAVQEIDLPLVPIMDTFVTLIAFLLMATSMLSVTLIDTPVPIVSSAPEDLKEKPLTLTMKIDQDGVRLESPFNLIKPVAIPRTEKSYDFPKIHEALVEIKKTYPKELKIIFMPVNNVKYDDLVQLMDSSRLLLNSDPAIFSQSEGQASKAETKLFPEVIFGNIVSGT